MTNKLLAATMLLGISGSVIAAGRAVHASPPKACRVQGVWDLVANVQAGKRTEFTGTQRKVVTKKHWIWVGAPAHRDTLPLKTALDSANYYLIGGGYGTYEVSGNHYTEHIDFFVAPRLQGRSLTTSCRVEGKQWFQTFLASDLSTGPSATPMSKDSVTEVWRRVE